MSSLLVFNTGDTVSHVGIFDPALWTIIPQTFSLVHLPPPPPLKVQGVGMGKFYDKIWKFATKRK